MRGIWKRGEMTSDLQTPIQSWEPLWKRKRTEEKEPSGSREVQRKKSWSWWGWGEDENWFIAALMRSGMPGDSGCSPSPCFGNIKRNRGPPSCYNCCRDLSNGLKSLPLFPISMSRCRKTRYRTCFLLYSRQTSQYTHTNTSKAYCKQTTIHVGYTSVGLFCYP